VSAVDKHTLQLNTPDENKNSFVPIQICYGLLSNWTLP